MSKRKAEDEGAGPEAKPNPAAAVGLGTGPEEGLLVHDLEINDLRNRYMLTKGPTQAQITEDTGAQVQTRGVWYPDKTLATERDPPLYLHVTAKTQSSLDAAVDALKKIMNQELGPLTAREQREERREKRKWPEEKCFVNLDSLRNFNLRAKIIGPGGLFVKHIQQETGVRVQIRGIGSGFIDTETGQEHQEPLHICLIGPDESQLARAKDLADDLLLVVGEEWAKAKAVLDSASYGTYNTYQGYAQPTAPLPPGEAPPMPGMNGMAAAPGQAAGGDAYAAYWQQIQSNPEYLAYYQQMMAAYGQGAQAPGGSPAPPPPAGSAPPAPPPSQPPPPPADNRREGSGRYGAVPPPSL